MQQRINSSTRPGSDVAPLQPLAQAGCERRRFLRSCLAAAGILAVPPAFARGPASHARSLAFFNLHTGERLHTTYWERGAYRREALGEIDWILRDFRTGETQAIDPRLLDLLYALHHRLASRRPFEVISGYRSPATNASLRARTSGVAKHSLHMVGKAVDLRLPGRSLSTLHRAALSLRAGGVGYYPRSDFVHVDVGRVRSW